MEESKLISILNERFPDHVIDYGVDSLFEDEGGLELTVDECWAGVYLWEEDLYHPSEETVDHLVRDISLFLKSR
jgi:hypothetical protein